MASRVKRFLLLCFVTIGGLSWIDLPQATAQTNEQILTQVAIFFRSARKVISDNQGLINEQRSGKNLTAARVIRDAKKNYRNASGKSLPRTNRRTLLGRLIQAELEAVEEVMNNAQGLINDPNLGFKGFLPAVFAKKVADAFRQRVGTEAYIKLTAPREWIRNRANRPDRWERNVIKQYFQAGNWEKGKPYTETTSLKGRKAFRLIIPEYYAPSCLGCHGEPKGAIDITGGKKEGGTLGELGGAISTGIFLQ